MLSIHLSGSEENKISEKLFFSLEGMRQVASTGTQTSVGEENWKESTKKKGKKKVSYQRKEGENERKGGPRTGAKTKEGKKEN